VAQNDFAILVGINRYADSSLQRLDGPLLDVKLVEGWLVDTKGGNVPGANIKKVTSKDDPEAAPTNGEMPPLFQDFLKAFLRLVRPSPATFIRRPASRLYLYFSGHGFCEKRKREPHAALYAANTDRDVYWNIYGTYFAQWTKDHGLFGEIVLVMDCCRDPKITQSPLVPRLRQPTDVGVGVNARLFELYAAPRGGKAQERPIASRKNEVHGLLTHAFFDALEHASPGASQVSTAAIKDYLEQRWSALCGTEPADPPEVVLPTNGEIKFDRPVSADLAQRFRLTKLKAGDEFELLVSRKSQFDRVAVVTIGPAAAKVKRTGQDPVEYPIVDSVFVVPLPATFYMAVAATRAGELLKCSFQAGGSDVEL
jgi:hypothetical protein